MFGEVNAWRAANGIIDFETTIAGDELSRRLHQLNAQMKRSSTRKNEPLHVLAHSHGTAILLAAAVNAPTSLVYRIILAGSDLSPFTGVAPFVRMARSVHSFYSPGDSVTGLPLVTAAGHLGFREGNLGIITGLNLVQAPLIYRLLPRVHIEGRFTQTKVPNIAHSASVEERQAGTNSWVGSYMARKFYAPLTASYRGRRLFESDQWIADYEAFRPVFYAPKQGVEIPSAFYVRYWSPASALHDDLDWRTGGWR